MGLAQRGLVWRSCMAMSRKYYLAAVLVFKDEAQYLKEWLDYHILIGFQHFYLYDNNSDDNPKGILKWYIENGIVTYRVLDTVFGKKPLCAPHRMEAITTYGPECEWMSFTDTDEFFITKNLKNNMHNILKRYEGYSAIEVRRADFGSNFLKKHEQALVIERFFRRARRSLRRPKVLARPEHIVGVVNAHKVIVKDDVKHPYSINVRKENLNKMGHWWREPPEISKDLFRINHYGCKSKEEFLYRSKYRDGKKASLKEFDGKCLTKFNQIIDKQIDFFVKYVQNNFVQLNYEKINQYYKSSSDFNLKSFLIGIESE